MLVLALVATVSGPGTPGGGQQVGAPAHGPNQRWGDAVGLAHEASKGRGNVAEPRSLQSKYPPIKGVAAPAARNEATVVAAPDRQVRGFDAATSRELPESRGRTHRTFANADGTRTTEFSRDPINFQRADGSWQPIDTRLVPEGGGWHNAADSVGIWTAPATGSGSVARIDLDRNHRLEFGVDGAAASTGQVNGSAVTYPSVRSDADLRLEATTTGLKETMVLRSPQAPHSWLFPLKLTGLTASVVDGVVVFRDEQGRERARIPRGFMADSAYDERMGEYATSYGVRYAVVPHQGGVAVRMTLDSAWLRDAKRVYPVTVDPPVDVRPAAASMYVQRNSDGSNFSRVDGDLKAGHATDSAGSYTAASYLSFFGVETALRNHKIFGARLALTNYHSWSCQARPVTVHPVTQNWTANDSHQFPGPAFGPALTSSSFAHGYIPRGQTTSPCPTATEPISLGNAGRDLVQRWVNGQQANFGLSVRASETDVFGWKKFTGVGTANPPRLSVTHTPFDATYKFINPVPEPPVTRTQSGKVKIAVTNRGVDTWTPTGYVLAYRFFNASGAYQGWAESAILPNNVPRGASVTLDAKIAPTPPGTWRFEFTMMRRGGPIFFTDEQIPPAALILRVVDVPPVVQAQFPPNGYSAPTLTPTFWARAVDVDAPPNSSLKYRFEICEPGPVNCFDSGRQPTPTWTVPVGRLAWSKTYQWRVFAFDGTSESPALPFSTLLTAVPQPEITAHLGNAPDGGKSSEFDPHVGNYTASAVDATVSTIGPQLSVVRTYNSLDPRRDGVFGAGWSSTYDMRITPDSDGSGNVVITYPDGQQARFGANLTTSGQPTGGRLVPPPGRFATMVPRTAAEGGGWTLTDKSMALYVFRPDGRLSEHYDNAGRSVAYTYGSDGKLATVTNRTSNRSLRLTWLDGRIRTVSTDPVNGAALTWTYTYDGDRLTKVCDPNDGCTRYEYTPGSHYRSTIVDSKPDSYWRLSEPSGATEAFSDIGINLGADKGRYKDAHPAAAGVLTGTDNTAVSFNGTTSAINLPDGLVKKSRELTIEMWFKTTSGGPLFGAQTHPYGTGPTGAVPVLYVGDDGKLRGQFWTGSVNQITTAGAVNDNQWHHVVLSSSLSTQTLFLDGQAVGNKTGVIDNSIFNYSQVGSSYTVPPSAWPQWGTTQRRSFGGVIDEVAVYQHPLGLPALQTHFRARAAADQMSKTVLPSGKTAAEMRYDTDRDRLSEYTDRNGGTWELAAPVISGDPTNIIRTVRVNDPAGRAHFYDYDPIRGRILRYLSPLGMETRPEDKPQPDETIPTPPDPCPPPPEGPPFCEVPIGGGPGSFPPVEFQGVRTFSYDDNGFQSTITDENANSITLTHDARGNVTSRKTCRDAGSCQTTYFEYTPVGSNLTDPRLDKVVAVRDARSSSATDNRFKTAYVYTTRGQLETQTTPDTAVVRHTYTTDSTAAVGGGNTPAGLVETTTDPRNAVTRYAYFRTGDLAQITTPTGLITRFTYDTLGRRIASTQISDTFPSGVTTTVAYDKLSHPTVHTGPSTKNEVTGGTHQLRTTTSYDSDGNPTGVEAVDLTGGDPTRTASLAYDEHNRVIRVTDAEGTETSFRYDSFGNRTRMVDASGVQYEYAYTARNKIAEVRLRGWTGDPDGAPPGPKDYLVLASYAYDLAGQLVGSADAMGRKTRYTYYSDGLQRQTIAEGIRNPNGTTRDLVLSENVYDAAGNLAKLTTAGGRVTTFETDPVGRRSTTVADPNGLNRRTRLTYDLAGNVTQVRMTGFESNTGEFDDLTAAEVVDYGYDPTGRQTSETVNTGTESLTTTYGYDQRGLVTSVTDPRGTAAHTTNIRYDELGRPVATTAPPVTVEVAGTTPHTERPVATTGYDTFGDLTHTTDPNNHTWRYGYDRLGRRTSTTSPDYTPPGASQPISATTTTTYDELGRVTADTSPSGAVTRYTYDQLSRLVQQTDPHPDNPGEPGGVWSYTYTRTGEPLSVTDPTGARTESTYDDLGRQVTLSQLERRPAPGTFTSKFGYDDAGNLTTSAAPSGAATSYTYDALDQLTKITSPAQVPTHFGYDRSGRQVKITDGEGRAQRTHFDYAGRPTQHLDLGPNGAPLRSVKFGYDRASNLATVTNRLGHLTKFTYDPLNRLTEQVEPVSPTQSITTSFGYDAASNQTRYTDGRGNATRHTVNAWGLPESVIEPATTADPSAAERTWTTAYDKAANAVTLSAPGGVQRTRTFDLLDHLVHETGAGAEAPTAERTFDHDPLGRLIKSSAPGGENRFAYNDRGALLSTGGPSGDTNFAYNADGNLTTRTDAAGTATYGYTNGRLSTIQDGLTAVTQTLSYNNADQLSDVDYGSGRMRELSYDQFGRLDRDELNVAPTTVVRSVPTVVAAVDYGYDNGDRLATKETTGVADAGVNTYGYDQADRLTTWTHDPTGTPPATTTTYGWDDASNRVSIGGQTATFDERNRLLNDGTSTYSYTARGTLATVDRGTNRQTVKFDAFDRLTTQGTATYTYDALDRVASRNGQPFAYTGASNELATDGATKFSRGPGDELLALQSGTNKRLTVADQHGDLIAGFDPTAPLTQVTDSTAYDPFGTPTATTGAKRPIGYQGDYTDPDTGEVNMTARWYNPGTGTFTSRDDVSLPTNPSSAANRYSYGAASPTNHTDPTGHSPAIPGSCVPDHPNVPVPFWCHNRPDGGYGSGSGPGAGGGGSSCGGLSPDARTFGPCCGLSPDARTFGPCGNGGGGSGGLGGGFTGSGGGSIYGGGRGAGGAGQARPDPSIAARKANRAAARNNPMPIPQAMLIPLYGGSTTAPVSSAPDIPSRATSDYRDPVDDVNRSYQELQDSLTIDNDTLLGTVKNTTTAPTEVTPANYQPGEDNDHYCDACNWPTMDGRYPGVIGQDGRPMIDFEGLEELGIELTSEEWQLFDRGTNEYRLSQLDPIPGYTDTPPCNDSMCGVVRGFLAFGACEFLTAGTGTVACSALGGAVTDSTNSQFTGENPALAASRGAILGAAGAALAEGLLGVLASRGAGAFPAPRVVPAPGGLKLPGVPSGATGVSVETGKGLRYTLPSGTPELDPRVMYIRVMDPTTTGKYQYPNGYVAYMNSELQTVNPLTGQTIPDSHPFAHIGLP